VAEGGDALIPIAWRPRGAECTESRLKRAFFPSRVIVSIMGARLKKYTFAVPTDLLERAMAATGQGITATIRRGLEVVASSRARERQLIRRLKSKQRVGGQGPGEDR